MRINNLVTAIFLLGTFPLLTLPASAQVLEGATSLRGLKGVDIVTEDIIRFDSADGLSGKLITDDVEEKLKGAGIEILSDEQEAPGNPYMHVDINYMKKDGFYNASIEVSLNQGVMLERDPSIKLSTITWMESELISGEEKDVGADIRKYLARIIRKFVSQWKSANQNKTGVANEPPNNGMHPTANQHGCYR